MAISEKEIEALAGIVSDSAVLNVSLRDLFAAFALAGLISQSDRSLPTKVFAEEAYHCADAMLAQRTKKD